MSRVSEDDVRDITDSDSSLNMNPFIELASPVVDYIESKDSGNILTSSQLANIEKLLAAHFYAQKDQQYSSKKTGDASAKFQTGAEGTGSYDTTQAGRNAMGADFTGCLANLNSASKTGSVKPRMTWLGKAPSVQTDYEDRD